MRNNKRKINDKKHGTKIETYKKNKKMNIELINNMQENKYIIKVNNKTVREIEYEWTYTSIEESRTNAKCIALDECLQACRNDNKITIKYRIIDKTNTSNYNYCINNIF